MYNLLLTGTGGSISGILSGASELLTWCIESMTSVASWVISTPITLMLVGIGVVSFGFGLVYRAIRKL